MAFNILTMVFGFVLFCLCEGITGKNKKDAVDAEYKETDASEEDEELL